ncbi:hypothetical protein MTR67_031051 [Solanum verrucosum]|uniref:PPM-type phosphatase domain-containing protein n=1 Tax=Solanum verrucosum TaxID=315347 RepID=A0AAF0ZD40_SOLVR|nr:hypothetical protein MTR67_031051 [Solanum verrucosum]
MERKQGFSWRQGRCGVWFIIREVRSEESIEKWVTHYFVCSYEKDLAFQTKTFLKKTFELGKGGSTAVTAMLINSQTLIIANMGDSQAVISKKGVAEQLSVDHEPNREREIIESKGGFVPNIPGDVPPVDGQLAIAKVFGDKYLKRDLSSDPNVAIELIDNDVDLIILASDGLWKVMSNQEAVNCIKNMKEVKATAKHLSEVAISWKSKDDISCIVKF